MPRIIIPEFKRECATARFRSHGLKKVQGFRQQRHLRTVTGNDIQFAQSRINNRPKKCLGFKQPAVIFKEMAMPA